MNLIAAPPIDVGRAREGWREDGLRKKPSVFGGLNHAMNEWAAARRIYVTGCGGGGRLHRCCAGAATASARATARCGVTCPYFCLDLHFG